MIFKNDETFILIQYWILIILIFNINNILFNIKIIFLYIKM